MTRRFSNGLQFVGGLYLEPRHRRLDRRRVQHRHDAAPPAGLQTCGLTAPIPRSTIASATLTRVLRHAVLQELQLVHEEPCRQLGTRPYLHLYQTGTWSRCRAAPDSNLNGDAAGDRAIVNPAGTSVGTGTTALKNSAGEVVASWRTTRSAQYIQAPKGTLPTRPQYAASSTRSTTSTSASEALQYHRALQMQFEIGRLHRTSSTTRSTSAVHQRRVPGSVHGRPREPVQLH